VAIRKPSAIPTAAWIAVARRQPRHRFRTAKRERILFGSRKRRGASLPAAIQDAHLSAAECFNLAATFLSALTPPLWFRVLQRAPDLPAEQQEERQPQPVPTGEKSVVSFSGGQGSDISFGKIRFDRCIFFLQRIGVGWSRQTGR
jgi:hypothetical protein